MEFTLALAHFCDKHGPKSVLCTQVSPLECTICIPPPPHRERTASFESYTTQFGHEDQHGRTTPTPRIRRTSIDLTVPSTPSKSSATSAAQREAANIEDHPYFLNKEAPKDASKFPFSQQHTEICASCSFAVPQKVAARLPAGAPGSLSKEGVRESSSAPVLRSREFVCLGGRKRRQQRQDPSSSQDSQATSVGSCGSVISHDNCHDHTLTYLTSKSPFDAEVFATLRNSVLRALSGEQLPQGMSEGPFCFGDPVAGYTIAYSFRLTDPKARGRVRRYAFIALAGQDAYRAFKACPMLWEAFALMAKTIEQAAQRYQDEQELQQQRERDEKMAQEARSGGSNISSFLTQRPRDADGQPRRVGQTLPMNLGEIIGDDNIFAVLHQYFIHVLRCLGDKFGGLPFAETKKLVYHTMTDQNEPLSNDPISSTLSAEILADMSLEEENTSSSAAARSAATGKPTVTVQAERTTKAAQTSATEPNSRSTSRPTQVPRGSQCAPLGTNAKVQQRVAA